MTDPGSREGRKQGVGGRTVVLQGPGKGFGPAKLSLASVRLEGTTWGTMDGTEDVKLALRSAEQETMLSVSRLEGQRSGPSPERRKDGRCLTPTSTTGPAGRFTTAETVLPGARAWGNAWLLPSSCSPQATRSALPPRAKLTQRWGRWEMDWMASRTWTGPHPRKANPHGPPGPASGWFPEHLTSGLACPKTHLRQRSCSGGAGSGQGRQAAPCIQ